MTRIDYGEMEKLGGEVNLRYAYRIDVFQEGNQRL